MLYVMSYIMVHFILRALLCIMFDGVMLQRKSLVNKIKTFFGDDMVVLHSPGIANVLMFIHNAANLITLVNVNEDDGLDLAVNTQTYNQ